MDNLMDVTKNTEKIRAYIAKGEEYILEGDLESARAKVESALNMHADLGSYAEDVPIQELFRKFTKKSPAYSDKTALLYFEKAKILTDRGDVLGAILPAFMANMYRPDKKKYRELYTDLVKRKKAEELKRKGISLKNMGRFKEAYEVLKAGSALKSRKVEFKSTLKDVVKLKEVYDEHLRMAIKFVKGEKYVRSREEITKALEMSPNSKKLIKFIEEVSKKEKAHKCYVYALKLYRQGKAIESAKHLDAALDCNPNFTAAMILLEKIRNTKIVETYDFSEVPDDTNMGVLSRTIGMLEEAVEKHTASPYFNKLYVNNKFNSMK